MNQAVIHRREKAKLIDEYEERIDTLYDTVMLLKQSNQSFRAENIFLLEENKRLKSWAGGASKTVIVGDLHTGHLEQIWNQNES